MHALRVGTPIKVPITIVDTAGRALMPHRWSQLAPWYVGRLLERWGQPATLDGAQFYADRPEVAGLLWLGAYETAERFAVAAFLPRALPVIEVGASIGVVSCLINRRLTKPASHIAVEANPQLIPALKQHRELNRCDFIVVNAAVAYDADSVQFHLSESNVAGAVREGVGRETVRVPACTLRSLVKENGISCFSLVCDIEGMETALVREEANLLKQFAHTIIMELHPEAVGEAAVQALSRTLADCGFVTSWQRGDVAVFRNSALQRDVSAQS